MKLKPTKKGMKNIECNNQEKKTKSKENKLPPDIYEPIFEPIRFLVRESFSARNPSKSVKQYIEISVKRMNDDEGLPFVWLQMYQESEMYTGYLKGKTIYLPLEMLYDLIDNLNDISEECDKRNIE